MSYAVQVYFDPAIDAMVRALWRRYADAGITRHLHESANRPHLTLAVYAHLDVTRARQVLVCLAAAHRQLPLTLSHLGGFLQPSPVAFLAPTVTIDLLRLHLSVHEALTGIGVEPQTSYAPGSWVPHCTIAFHMDYAAFLRVIDLCQTITLPLRGTACEIGIAEVSPTRLIFSTDLSDGE